MRSMWAHKRCSCHVGAVLPSFHGASMSSAITALIITISYSAVGLQGGTNVSFLLLLF